jgi:hypothetical protein
MSLRLQLLSKQRVRAGYSVRTGTEWVWQLARMCEALSMADTAKPENTAGDSAKDAFREALERKRTKLHPHESASQNDPKVNGAHGAVGGKRNFRRKSGG